MNTLFQKKNIEKKTCISLVLCLLVLFAMYVYFISASIVHVVIRTELDQQVSKVSSQISLLESSYITAQYKVSNDIASLQGYTQTSEKFFIDRSSASLVLLGDTER